MVRRRDARGALGLDVLADEGQRAVRWDVVARPGAQIVDELIELRVRDLVEVAVVHLQTRRLGACGDALVALEEEKPVVGATTRLRAEMFFGMLEQLVTAAEEA